MNRNSPPMYIKVLKGTRTDTVGAFTEIKSEQGRILIDFGDDLDDIEPKRLPVIERTNHRHTNI